MVPVLVKHDLHVFCTTRSPTNLTASPRSRSTACGEASGFLQHLLQGAAVALAIVVAVLPGRRGTDAGRPRSAPPC